MGPFFYVGKGRPTWLGCVKDAEGGDEGAGADPPQRGGTDTPQQPDGGAGFAGTCVRCRYPAGTPKYTQIKGKSG
jgi:hypothetical protein